MRNISADIERLSIPVPESGCWIWVGTVDKDGYGKKRYSDKGRVRRYSAHRLAYSAYNGDIPDGMMVCHRCDNPACVNPDHLFLGTAADNNADRDAKGRTYSRPEDATCHKGHPLAGDNLMKCGHCRQCSRERSRERYQKVRSDMRKNATRSGIAGVYFVRGLWRVQIFTNGKYHHIGSYDNILDAAAARRSAENQKRERKQP